MAAPIALELARLRGRAEMIVLMQQVMAVGLDRLAATGADDPQATADALVETVREMARVCEAEARATDAETGRLLGEDNRPSPRRPDLKIVE